MDSGSSIALSCGVGCRCSSDLWLWYRPVAAALIRFLALELPSRCDPKKKKKKKTTTNNVVVIKLKIKVAVTKMELMNVTEKKI